MLLFSGLLSTSLCQVVISQENKLPATEDMYFRVKQFNQFVERFNYSRIFSDKKLDLIFKSQFNRSQCIEMLFNTQDIRIDSLNKHYVPELVQLKDKFITTIIHDSLYLSTLLHNVYVEAKCVILYRGKHQAIKLILEKFINEDDASGWKIISSDANFLDVKQIKTYIPPNSNETAFMKLIDVFENAYNGSIAFKHCKQQTYHVLSIDGWAFTVKDFNRDSKNSGWLIDDLLKWKKDKNAYLNLKFGL